MTWYSALYTYGAPLDHPQVLRLPCLCGRIRGGRCASRPHSGEPTLTLTPTFNLTLTRIFTPSPTQSPTLTPDSLLTNQESEEQIDLDCTCIWIRLASGAATGDLTSSLIAPLPDRDAIQAATPSPADQRPARTHLAITSPHTDTAAVVNIATGVVSLVDIPRHERQQQQRHSARLPPPHAMGVQPWSPSPTPRHRPTASCSDSVVEGTAGKQSGAKGGSAETAERNPGPNLELHLEKSRSLDQQLLGIWDTVRLLHTQSSRARARARSRARAVAIVRAHHRALPLTNRRILSI